MLAIDLWPVELWVMLIFLLYHLYLFPVFLKCAIMSIWNKMTSVSRNENNKCHKRKVKLHPLTVASQVQFTDFISILEDFFKCT